MLTLLNHHRFNCVVFCHQTLWRTLQWLPAADLVQRAGDEGGGVRLPRALLLLRRLRTSPAGDQT